MDVKSKDQDKDNAFSNADANGEIFKELHILVNVSSSSQEECKDITGWKKRGGGKIMWR